MANNEAITKTAKWLLVDFPGYVVKIAATWGIIWGGLYVVAEPHISPYLELPAKVESSNRRVSALERSVKALSPSNTVAEYDILRSQISDGKCKLGDWCEGEFRVRRLPEGLLCEAPEIQAFVTNHGGVTRPVTELEATKVRVSAEWVNLPFKFKIPNSSQPGVGEFYYQLNYQCPDGEKSEPSTVIVFDILK